MNFQDIIVYDFETGGKNPNMTQPTELAAVVIHGRKLEIQPDGVFSSLIKPFFDDNTCAKYGVDPIEDEALDITGIKREDLKKAPSIKEVWKQFVEFTERFNHKGSRWGAPIKCGYNNHSFDDVIIDRITGGHNRKINKRVDFLVKTGILTKEDGKKIKIPEPYGFGPYDHDREEEALFFPRDNIDIMKAFIWTWTENMSDMRSLSMGAIRTWLGIDDKGAHRGEKDVIDEANILIRFLKLHRHFAGKVQFKGAMKK